MTVKDVKKFRESQLGKRFGTQTIIAIGLIKKKSQFYWVQCDCGSDPYTRNLQGIKKSKGCRSCGIRASAEAKIGKGDDLTGKQFGNLIVLELSHRKRFKNHLNMYWKCKCLLCGKGDHLVQGNHLKNGSIKACSCNDPIKETHGCTDNPLYGILDKQKRRCNDSEDPMFHYYGARGISVYSEWLDPITGIQKFIKYVELICPKVYTLLAKGYSVDRENNDGNYEPGNIRIVDHSTQMRNTRRSVKVLFNNKIQSLRDIYDQIKNDKSVKYDTFRQRVNEGIPIGEAIKRKRLTK